MADITVSADIHSFMQAANAAAGRTTLAAAALGANTFTALQTITQASANAGILASTGYSLTGSNATNMIDLAGTWNTTGAPTAIKLNLTNTASDAASLLLDYQLAGTSKIRINAATGAHAVYHYNAINWAVYDSVGGTLRSYENGGRWYATDGFYHTTNDFALGAVGISGLMLSNSFEVGWSADATYYGTNDLSLSRSAAGILAVLGNATGAAIEFTEMTAPSAGAANTCRLYTEDNGAGKTRLMALFNSGAAQQVAIEP